MQSQFHTTHKHQVIEFISQNILIKTPQEALELMMNTDSEYIILHKHNFESDFFDLSTKKLGDILQKFTNYQKKLAIIGDFNNEKSQTLKDFIYESNLKGDYLFISSLTEVEKYWNKS